MNARPIEKRFAKDGTWICALPGCDQSLEGRKGLARFCSRRHAGASLRLRNPESHRAKTKRWKQRNPERAAEASREYFKSRPDAGRHYQYKRKYGMTLEDYNARVASQGGCCAICGRKPRQRLAVDHNHDTGQIRALLCLGCNTTLGAIERVGSAEPFTRYLTHWEAVRYDDVEYVWTDEDEAHYREEESA